MQKIIDKYMAGYSAREVAEEEQCGLAKVYYILRKNDIPRRSARATNAIRFEKSPLSFSIPTDLTPEQEKLKYLALGLYWGEGSKNGVMVDLINSDPKVIKVFLLFLRQILFIDEKKLRIYLYCFENQNKNQLITYWSSCLSIPKSQFTKPYVRKRKNNSKRIMLYGVIHLRYSDKRLLRYLLSEINKFESELVGGGGFEPPKA